MESNSSCRPCQRIPGGRGQAVLAGTQYAQGAADAFRQIGLFFAPRDVLTCEQNTTVFLRRVAHRLQKEGEQGQTAHWFLETWKLWDGPRNESPVFIPVEGFHCGPCTERNARVRPIFERIRFRTTSTASSPECPSRTIPKLSEDQENELPKGTIPNSHKGGRKIPLSRTKHGADISQA